jgi:hypothetical protein
LLLWESDFCKSDVPHLILWPVHISFYQLVLPCVKIKLINVEKLGQQLKLVEISFIVCTLVPWKAAVSMAIYLISYRYWLDFRICLEQDDVLKRIIFSRSAQGHEGTSMSTYKSSNLELFWIGNAEPTYVCSDDFLACVMRIFRRILFTTWKLHILAMM